MAKGLVLGNVVKDPETGSWVLTVRGPSNIWLFRYGYGVEARPDIAGWKDLSEIAREERALREGKADADRWMNETKAWSMAKPYSTIQRSDWARSRLARSRFKFTPDEVADICAIMNDAMFGGGRVGFGARRGKLERGEKLEKPEKSGKSEKQASKSEPPGGKGEPGKKEAPPGSPWDLRGEVLGKREALARAAFIAVCDSRGVELSPPELARIAGASVGRLSQGEKKSRAGYLSGVSVRDDAWLREWTGVYLDVGPDDPRAPAWTRALAKAVRSRLSAAGKSYDIQPDRVIVGTKDIDFEELSRALKRQGVNIYWERLGGP